LLLAATASKQAAGVEPRCVAFSLSNIRTNPTSRDIDRRQHQAKRSHCLDAMMPERYT
jgi:hypothetical protein